MFIAIVLGILTLTLVLIRIDSRQEERTLVTQGADLQGLRTRARWQMS